ncbi:MAG: hypothetical protein IJU54_02255 [Alphaproteobacteria bacterium]|nr:hypothetical protein [Alphaproteobacteria bacterium]
MKLEAIKNRIVKVLDICLYKISSINFNNPNVILVCDSLIASTSLLISVQLRVGIACFDSSYLALFNTFVVFGLVSAGTFIWLKASNQSFKYNDINRLLLSILISNTIFVPLLYFMHWNSGLPFSIIVINIFVMIVLLLGLRYVYFILFKMNDYTLLIGNRSSISIFFNSYNDVMNCPVNNMGIINTNPDIPIYSKTNIPVIGNIMDINYIISRTNVNQVIITDSAIIGKYKEKLIDLSKKYKFLLVEICANTNK